MNAMWGKVRQHWRFTTVLFVVGGIELGIVALYLTADLSLANHLPRQSNNSSLAVFGAHLPPSGMAEVKQPSFSELFKPASGIERRLPKLLHDYFKEMHKSVLSSPELVGLLRLEIRQITRVTLQKDTVVFYVNPHNPASSDNILAIAIKKDLLTNELKDEYKLMGDTGQKENFDYKITTQPRPGATVEPQEKMLSLTFDDGPDGGTHALLDVLDKFEASATFFVLGQKVAGGVGVLQRMVRDGHEIGNHSWSHPDLRKLPSGQAHSQIFDTQNAIKNATGFSPTLMRPPYGATNPAVETIIRGQGLHQAMWNVDSNDWRDKNSEMIYHRIMGSAADGRVILLHDIHPSSVEAAVRAIPDLKARGYQLVTMTQLELYR